MFCYAVFFEIDAVIPKAEIPSPPNCHAPPNCNAPRFEALKLTFRQNVHI